MHREKMQASLQDSEKVWDIIIIGGGATGLGAAIDAASRGYQTLLLEQSDFGKGTSGKSTKLVHGGVRYLQQGNISLVLEALKERGLLAQNAPHLVHPFPFIVPAYHWWETPFYGIGLKIYDLLAGKYSFGASRILSAQSTRQRLPGIQKNGLKNGILYFDGQFDDARLALNLAQTAIEQGACVLNYMPVTGLILQKNHVSGVIAKDLETNTQYNIPAKIVINATGVYADQVRQMENPRIHPMIKPSQGIHIVLDASFLPGKCALMVPRTDDGRVLFAIPWHQSVVVGTTDTPVDELQLEPEPLAAEIEFLLAHAGRYFTKKPKPADVKSVFVGLRPLVNAGNEKETKSISREHTLHVSEGGLLTITGGKWTTYRKMAQDTIDRAIRLANLPPKACVTAHLKIHGFREHADEWGVLAVYGSDAPAVQALCQEKPEYAARLHAALPVLAGEVIWAARHEMARTVEDVLSRRTRGLVQNARASIEMAPRVAALLAAELGRDESWQKQQIAAFQSLASGYLLKSNKPA